MLKMKKVASKLLTAALAIAMVLTVVPETPAAAANTDSSSADENLVLNKQVWLEDDGTYTIQLEAYAKGNVSKETYKKVVPADIVLVLDQSGSMKSDEYKISGIPGDTYSKVTGDLTNAAVAEGSYYYKVGDTYYPVNAKKETVGVETKWVGQDGKTYTDDEISYSWSRASDGQVYNTAKPFVTASLKTYTRESRKIGLIESFWYTNDKDSEDTTKVNLGNATDAKTARNTFTEKKATSSNTIEFQNDGAPSNGDAKEDNPFYVAAVYTTVTKEEVKTYRYTYSYTDAEGNTITIGSSESGDDAVCAITPLYTRDTTTGYRLDALQYAAKNFIANIYANAKKNNVDHRVAVVGFGSDEYKGYTNEYYYSNSELFVGATQYNYHSGGKNSTYNQTGNLAADHYKDAFQSILTDNGHKNVLASIDALAGKGATYPSIGFDMANGIFNANANTYTMDDGTTGKRSRIVIFLTDGEPGDTGYDDTEATATLTKVGITKEDYSAKVYTVAVLSSEPTTDSNVDTFLKKTASSGEYTLATDTAKLEDFFDSVDQNISSTTTTVELSKDAVMVDLWSDYFVAPDGFSAAENVTVKTAKHKGNDSFANPSETPAGVNVAATKGTDGKVNGIQVSGFNYISEDNMVTTTVSNGGSTVGTGNKLVVTITGLLAKDEAAVASYIDTNKAYSAIWDTDADGAYGIIKAFEIPQTMLDKKLVVLDYAKAAKIDAHSASKIDSAADLLFSKVGENSRSLTGQYGKISFTEADELTYTPTTMQWNGYEFFYALGKDNTVGDRKTKNIWSKVTVIPANNVYYEDEFVTSTDEGTVGITYSGEWKIEGELSDNQETADTEIHGGWQNKDLADDQTFTNGTAHVSSTSGATATFTFTGRGVDIYSYTDMQSGVIRAKLYKINDTEDAQTSVLTKSYIIDNYAESGTYYQIPTASFMDLEYGTYKVEITVLAKDNIQGNRSTYYLDGIRIYNPITEDALVQEAYGDEADASFKSIREILLDADTLTVDTKTANGVVFIDQITTEDSTATNTTTSVIGTYEEFGPKNEVYLTKGQAIAFQVDMSNEATYSIGLKAMAGEPTTAKVSAEDGVYEYTVKAASDLYYRVIPNADGLIMIQNTGDALLSVTKLKTCSSIGDGVEEVNVAMLMAYADEFDSLEVIDLDKEPGDEQLPDVDIKDDTTDKDDVQQDDYSAVLQKIVKEIIENLRDWFGR